MKALYIGHEHDWSIVIAIFYGNNVNGTFIFWFIKDLVETKKINGQRREKKQWCKKKEYMQSKE